ncbi:hypothetical protein AB3N02_22195 [Priestia aryabhattai]|uniref:hypothetical protein n=1 Tax=Priestia aryabhattai TaxID=412384 RepID=UPI0039A371E6
MCKLGIHNVEYKKEAFCEHCYKLEPYSATVEDGADYCLDCMRYNDDFEITEQERNEILLHETQLQIKYYKEKYESYISYAIELTKKAKSYENKK